MESAETLAMKAAENGPTLYAELMNFALAEPRAAIYKEIEDLVRSAIGTLAMELCEQLRKAYVAGVADGYRVAVMGRDE